AFQQVVAFFAEDGVVAIAAERLVVTAAADDGVVAGVAVEEVVAGPAFDVAADGGVDEDLVVPAIAVGGGAEPPAEEDEVVAVVSDDEVDVGAGVEVVGLVGALDSVVAWAGEDGHSGGGVLVESDPVGAGTGLEGFDIVADGVVF